jgi:aminoglycoside phosphotransferase (APT) family kinase protein
MMPSPLLFDDVRALVSEVIGGSDPVRRVEALQVRDASAVLMVTTAADVGLVVKVAAAQANDPVCFERTAVLTALARSTGAPVPEVLAADDSLYRSRWRYLIAEHIDGVSWRELRPRLSTSHVAAAHRALAETLLRVQSLRFTAYGELDVHGHPAVGRDIVTALHQRADLRVHDPHARATFHEVLTRDGALFASQGAATLCHDDVHRGNVLFRKSSDGWQLVALLDWDKAWAGPAESDVARMAFWDDMTGPGFWEVYPAPNADDGDAARRALIYQLLWCLEYDDGTARHAADTTRLLRLLTVP